MVLKGSATTSTRRIMYSVGNNACMPTSQSKNFNSSAEYSNRCTGYDNSKNANFSSGNNFSDEFTFAMPGSFSMYVSYSGSPNKYGQQQTISPWYAKNEGFNGTDAITCADKGKTARKIENVHSCSSLSNTKSCSYSNKPEEYVLCPGASGPRWFTDIKPYYYRCHNSSGYCSNSSDKSYGCTGERKFLCSGCYYCSDGIGYKDWSDSDGGL